MKHMYFNEMKLGDMITLCDYDGRGFCGLVTKISCLRTMRIVSIMIPLLGKYVLRIHNEQDGFGRGYGVTRSHGKQPQLSIWVPDAL